MVWIWKVSLLCSRNLTNILARLQFQPVFIACLINKNARSLSFSTKLSGMSALSPDNHAATIPFSRVYCIFASFSSTAFILSGSPFGNWINTNGFILFPKSLYAFWISLRFASASSSKIASSWAEFITTPSFTEIASVISPSPITASSSTSLYSTSVLVTVVADTLTVCIASKYLSKSLALAVLFECSSSTIIRNFIPELWAILILSYKLSFSFSVIALLSFFVTLSQFMKLVLPASKPLVKASFKSKDCLDGKK